MAQQVTSKGIFHGLPVCPQEPIGSTAIITGANGISGHHMLRVLSQAPERWKKIYCLSRRPPTIQGGLPDNHRLFKKRNVTSDHVFFFTYLQPAPKEGQALWSNADEMVQVNTDLLRNFLEALKAASITPKRFLLQTGAKNYGGHLGPTKLPQEESDPRDTLEPNFYYPQEDLLFAYSKETGCGWTIAMPGPITGAVPDVAMNYAYPLAIYASIYKTLNEPLTFPGDAASWQMPQSMSYAMMNAYLEEWAVLSGPADEKYNACDDSAFTWESAWPAIAGWFGLAYEGPGDADEGEFIEKGTRFNPRGYGSPGVSRRKSTMVSWVTKGLDILAVRRELAEKHGSSMPKEKDLERIFGFHDGTLVRPAPLILSMDKSKKLGWHGFVDSKDALLEVFRDLAKLKMIPPIRLATEHEPARKRQKIS